jgi:1-deoxy-D-xylulose-5-phosphate synthase
MNRYLDMVDNPSHVKKLTPEQTQQLAAEIRQELITKLARNGGHLGPNLGVVELTIALHRCFSTPHDKFVWDVSHQVYVHKLLTGRKDRFHTIRTTDGLNGFALRTESEHDCYGAGHAGTALSAALGMCAARDQRKSDEHVVCIFGDAALTNGISFEALNNISHTTKKFIGILNDNEWSIAKNVGAIAGYLNKLITNPSYNRLQKEFESFMRRMPRGEITHKIGHKVEEAVKGVVKEVTLRHNPDTPDDEGRGGFGSSLIFEELGLRYLGPIDGHDLPLLIKSLEFAKQCQEPIVLHVLTQKGKGYDVAIQHPEKFHGLGPYDVTTGSTPAAKPGTPPAYQDVFGQTMVRHADGHGAEAVGEGDAAALLRRGDCRGTRRHIRGRHGDDGFPPGGGDLLDLPAAGLRLHPSRRLPAGSSGDFLHGPGGAERQRRPDAPRVVRHQLSALSAERDRDGAEGRG